VVASIEETTIRLGISKSFIGLILLPVAVSTFHVTLGASLDPIHRRMHLNILLPCLWP
jgi:Ca2+/H+ antiporter